MQDFKDDIERLAKLWDKAKESDVFKDSKPAVPSHQTSSNSFFGFTDSHPSDAVDNKDAQYWNDVNDKVDNLPMSMMHEANAKNTDIIKKKVAGVAAAPNPIRQTTVGKDQDLNNPATLDASYNNEDLNKIADLKDKLHKLQDKLNTLDAKGGKVSAIEKQIDELSKKIDDLSDSLGQPPQISSGG